MRLLQNWFVTTPHILPVLHERQEDLRDQVREFSALALGEREADAEISFELVHLVRLLRERNFKRGESHDVFQQL